MFEEMKKKIEQGIDVAFANAEKVAQSAKDLAKEYNLNKEEAKKLYDYLLQKSEDARKFIDSEVQQALKTAVKKMDLVTQDELKTLQARIAKLETASKSTSKAKKTTVKTKVSGKTHVKSAV